MADKGKVCFLFFGIMSTDESFTIRAGTSAEHVNTVSLYTSEEQSTYIYFPSYSAVLNDQADSEISRRWEQRFEPLKVVPHSWPAVQHTITSGEKTFILESHLEICTSFSKSKMFK